jgi:hypothetical protein
MQVINNSNSSAKVQFTPESGGGKKQNITVSAGSNMPVQLDGDNDYNVVATIDGNPSNQLNSISNDTSSVKISFKNGQTTISSTPATVNS